MKITLTHGSGGKATSELIQSVFAKHFSNPVLNKMEDSAVVPGAKTIAMTTDSFVVTPLFFSGGDIGRLAVCGTVNDLAMSGAVPKFLTCGFIIEEGVDSKTLESIVESMAETAAEAHVLIVAGDTKVVEGKGGVFINTAGVGYITKDAVVSASNCKDGDVVILSGNLGDHHAAILSARMNINNTIQSDCAPLNAMTAALMDGGVQVRAMRDVTRGGLATILNEFASASKCTITLDEEKLPVSDQVRGFCGLLGLDPLYMGNEGKMVAVVAKEDAEKALRCIQNSPYGENAAIVGKVTAGKAAVLLRTAVGGTRVIAELYDEGLPRIC